MMMSIELGALFFLILVLLGVFGFIYLFLRVAFTLVRWLAEAVAELIGWMIRPFAVHWHTMPDREERSFFRPGLSDEEEAEALMLCTRPQCGFANPPHSRFCARCGIRLE